MEEAGIKKQSSNRVVDIEKETGFPSTLNLQQQQGLLELKELIQASSVTDAVFDIPNSDEYLLRVLRATMLNKKSDRVFQAKDAFERLQKILDFKKKFNLNTPPPFYDTFRRVNPRFAYRDYKAKKVVMVNRIGEFISNAKFSHFSEDEWTQGLAFGMERVEREMRELSTETGVENRGYISITDVKGLSLSAVRQKKATIFLANVSSENYPEVINKVYLINAPWIFEKIFAVIKPFLDPQTLSKFHIHHSIPDELKEILDIEKLPKEFGGNLEVIIPYPMDSSKFKEEYFEKLPLDTF